MSFRPLIHIPRGAVRLILLVILCGIGLFFIATRTEVGRDLLRSEIERQFNDRFTGQLKIGMLRGNLVYRFTALGIELRDVDGSMIVKIDSAVARPRWRRVAQGRIEFGQLHLFGMDARLARDADGSWNFERALVPRAKTDSAGGRIGAVAVGDLRIVNSRLATTNTGDAGSLVRNGVLFDYQNASATIREARAIIDWRPADAQVDLITFSGKIDNRDFDLLEVQGQVVLNDNSFLVNQVSVRTPNSRLKLTGSLDRHGDRDRRDPAIELTLDADQVDHTELSRLLPRSPFRGTSELIARLRGPLSAVVVEELTIASRATRVTFEGTAIGLPDSIDFELSIPRGTVRRRELRTLLADQRILGLTDIDSLDVSLLARGVVRDPFGQPNGTMDMFLDAGGDAGGVAGRISLSLPRGGPLGLSSDLFLTDLRLDRAVPRIRESTTVSGDVSLTATGADPRDMVGVAEISLVRSRIFDRPVDSLRVAATIEGGTIKAEVQASEGAGYADARLVADLTGERQRYAATVRTRHYDLGPVLRSDSMLTAVTGQAVARFSLSQLQDLTGEITFSVDSSSVDVPGRQLDIEPGTLGMSLTRPESGITSLKMSGDIVEGQIDVRGGIRDLIDGAVAWGAFIRRTPEQDSLSLYESNVSTTGEMQMAVAVNGSLSIRNSRTLSALLPSRPEVSTGLTTDFSVTMEGSRAAVRIGLEGDSLDVGRVEVDGYAGSLFLSADRSKGLLSSLTVSGSLSADRVSLGGDGVPDLGITLNYRDEQGDLALTGGRGERVGPLETSAKLLLTSRALTITPERLDVRAGGFDWSLREAAAIELTGGSVRTRYLVLESAPMNGGQGQRIEARGAISTSPDDRLLVRTDRLELEQFSRVLSLRTSLYGRLDGVFVLARQNDTPLVEAEATITGLGLDQRVLGDLSLTSYINPGAAEGILELELVPTSITDRTESAIENRATISGMFRLPSFDVEGTRTDVGLLDLTATLDRADLFFFEYIFPGTIQNVTGYTAGSIQIGGSLSRPVFDADLRIVDGHFDVPRFNLAMSLSADVDADRYGIRVRRADVVDKTRGTVVLTGDILFNDYKYFSFNLEGLLDRFQIMDVASSRDLPFYGHIWASGTASLTGPLSSTVLRASNARTTPDSEIYIPLVESQESSDAGFIVFADSTGEIPDLAALTRRRNLLARRPTGERGFTEGMGMELNIDAPPGSTVHLVIDPLLGDVMNGVGSGRVQILRNEGEFQTFGSFQVNSGDYLFTAGEVFVRRFVIEEGGLIVWDGDPADAGLDIPASYRTRASRAGLQASTDGRASLIPVVVNLKITGRVSAPEINLALTIDRSSQTIGSTSDQEFLETILNNPQLSAEYATSVLLTNSFALTTSGSSSGNALGSGAFNSLSQLIAAQLNRYLSTALPNVDFSFGVQGQTSQELDITYGVALRLLDERLVIRGEGVYQGAETSAAESLQGEFVVEVRLSGNVSVEVFYRREGDLLVRTLTSTTGAGLSYRTEFPTWRRFLDRLFGWMIPDRNPPPAPADDVVVTTMSDR